MLTLTANRIIELLKIFSHDENRLSRLFDKLNGKDVVISEVVVNRGPIINVYGIRVANWKRQGNQYYLIIEKLLDNLRALNEDTLISVHVKKNRLDPMTTFILMDNARSEILGILGDGA